MAEINGVLEINSTKNWIENVRTTRVLQYPKQERFGDELIHFHVHKLVAEKIDPGIDVYAASRNQDTPQSSVRQTDDNTKPIQQAVLADLAVALGKEFTSDIDVNKPLPLRTIVTENFSINAEKIRTEGKNIQERFKSRPIVLLYQAGSISTKRLSIEAIDELSIAVREKYPSAYIVAATDGVYHDHVPQLSERDKLECVDHRLYRPTLNELGAWAYAAKGLIGTDTGYSWFTSSCFADKFDGKITPRQAFFLFTVADPVVWGIPGANNVESDFLISTKAEMPNLFRNGVIPVWSPFGSVYTEYYNGRGTYKGMSTPIADEDLKKFLNVIQDNLDI